MLLVSSLCVSLFVLSCAEDTPVPDDYIDGWAGQEDGRDLTYKDFIQKRKEAVEKIVPLDKTPCNVPKCRFPPCEENGPPPFCPRNVTFCRFGCACIQYCKDNDRRNFCYQTKFCRTPRRFSPDDNFFSTTAMPIA